MSANLIERFKDLFKTRAVSVEMIRQQAWYKLDELAYDEQVLDYPYLHEVFLEDSANYVVFFDEGKAFRMNFTLAGGIVEFQQHQQIQFIHAPVENTRFKVFRAKSGDNAGDLVWYGVACSNVVNRDGEIDSSLLFQQFEDEFESYDHSVTLRFYHETDPKFFIGEVLGVQRQDNLLVAWGTIDESNPLANGVSKGINSGEYGMSIGYMPAEKARKIEVSDGLTLPVYDSGTLIEISMLKADDAAAPFTKLNQN
jgi:hypothetical protein